MIQISLSAEAIAMLDSTAMASRDCLMPFLR